MARQSGFTLIEIMVVVIIIGVLSAIVAPAVIGRIEDARVEVAKVDLRTIASALKMYRVDNFGYPSNDLGLLALIEDPRDASAPGGEDADADISTSDL